MLHKILQSGSIASSVLRTKDESHRVDLIILFHSYRGHGVHNLRIRSQKTKQNKQKQKKTKTQNKTNKKKPNKNKKKPWKGPGKASSNVVNRVWDKFQLWSTYITFSLIVTAVKISCTSLWLRDLGLYQHINGGRRQRHL
jgi:hypothetical protein